VEPQLNDLKKMMVFPGKQRQGGFEADLTQCPEPSAPPEGGTPVGKPMKETDP
jgi:hypothetical protein